MTNTRILAVLILVAALIGGIAIVNPLINRRGEA